MEDKTYFCDMKFTAILCFCTLSFYFQADVDKAIVEDCFARLAREKDTSPANMLPAIALSFRESPYQANTLEVNEKESLIINLQAFDCMTFVETCLAMHLAFQSDQPDVDAYGDYLRKIRYRNGVIDGYTSRLHYVTDWIRNNESAGFIRNISEDIGGEILPLQLNYMSSHASSYKQLMKHPEDIPVMQAIEASVNAGTYYYIPINELQRCAGKIQSGDMLFFVTSLPGLDVSHAGIAYRNGKSLTFIHASTSAKKVVVHPGSLLEYCRNSKRNKGVIVCRMSGVNQCKGGNE
jgi:hypothetical protein